MEAPQQTQPNAPISPAVSLVKYDEFAKLDIRVAKILSAERVEGANKLYKLRISLGTEERTLAAGIAPWYPDPAVLVGKSIAVIANLEPRTVRGITSQGMLLAASEDNDQKVVLLTIDGDVAPGSKVR
jgi:methionine--tRNA ligase beta chain